MSESYVISNIRPGDLLLKNSDVELKFIPFFNRFKTAYNYKNLSYRVSSMWRVDDRDSYHFLQGQAFDVILFISGDYAPLKIYRELFDFLKDEWPGGVGLNASYGNIHLHFDLRPEGNFSFWEKNSGIFAAESEKRGGADPRGSDVLIYAGVLCGIVYFGRGSGRKK